MAGADLMHDIPDDLGRRLAARRRELGLTAEEVERRAGLETGYVAYVEEQSATPSPRALGQLAQALETDVDALAGDGAPPPDGGGPGQPGRRLERLDHKAAHALIERGGVGRIALTRHYAPVVMPVNFIVDDGDIVIRTTPGSQIAVAAGSHDRVSFEVDHLDEQLSQGWSVVATGAPRGRAGRGGRHAARARLAVGGRGERRLVVRLVPGTLTGRRIRAD
jgi:transcriptional regulator with XRE-family HTH domain